MSSTLTITLGELAAIKRLRRWTELEHRGRLHQLAQALRYQRIAEFDRHKRRVRQTDNELSVLRKLVEICEAQR